MRIWVTGIGVVSPLGASARATMDALVMGRRAFDTVSLFDAQGCRSRIAAEARSVDVGQVAPAGEAEGWSRTDAMALVAAREALAQAELRPESQPIDLVVGGTTAGMFETEDLLAEMHADPEARRPLERMLSHPLSATADRLCQAAGPFRRARTICSACSSGANALLVAASWLTSGSSERVLAGGADGLCRLTYVGFSCLGALSPEPCRPFDRRRDGLSIGEGAGFLVLETEASARARGATPIVELRGWAVGAEAHHITNPEPSGRAAARVMRCALARARITPSELDYVNAHGTATPLNDKMESAALRGCLGAEIDRVPVSSTKGQIGHTLGAAGAIEGAVAAMAVARGELPPTAGLEEIDPECQLVHLREARRAKVRAAMSNSFGFGGSDTVVVFAAPGVFPDEPSRHPRKVFVSGAATVGALGARGTAASAAYVEAGPAPQPGPIAFDPKEHLDLERARRMDRASRLAAAAMQIAIAEVGSALGPSVEPTGSPLAPSVEPTGSPLAPSVEPKGARAAGDRLERTGAIVGEAFGLIDDCSAFIHRFYDKGARFASPAVFPNLLPSSPVAHASIYHRLQGAVFSSADLSATSEGAIVAAAELILADEADSMFAGGVEQASPITEAVLDPLHRANGATTVPRGEGAVVLLLEAESTLERRPIAELSWWASWRGELPPAEVRVPRLPEGRAAVFVGCDGASARRIIEALGWNEVERFAAAPRAGSHESAGGFAAAAAVGRLSLGDLDCALVVGASRDRGYALLLERVAEPR
jgi:3-oxoacyl-[acyl-carrier-protein] synthase II